MRLSDIKGKCIVGIRQARYRARPQDPKSVIVDVLALILDDGTRLKPMTLETELGEYAHTFVVTAPATRRNKR